MQFTIATIAAFAAVALAAPAVIERQVGLCSSGNPVCCATDVLNLANLDCAPRKNPPPNPRSGLHRAVMLPNTFPSYPHSCQCQRIHRHLRYRWPAGQVLLDSDPRPGAPLLRCQPHCRRPGRCSRRCLDGSTETLSQLRG